MFNLEDAQTLCDEEVAKFQLPPIAVSINARLRLVQGRAFYTKNKIELSTFLGENDWRDTLLHEIAHIMNYVQYQKKGHGRSWKYCATLLGARPERCAEVQLERVTRWTYKCGEGCEFETINLHPSLDSRRKVCMKHKNYMVAYPINR
jgi:predicted SprT family Zn-dependent metalloprotease